MHHKGPDAEWRLPWYGYRHVFTCHGCGIRILPESDQQVLSLEEPIRDRNAGESKDQNSALKIEVELLSIFGSVGLRAEGINT